MSRELRKSIFTEAERELQVRTHALAVDAQGSDTLISRTADESAAYMTICDRALVGQSLSAEERAGQNLARTDQSPEARAAA